MPSLRSPTAETARFRNTSSFLAPLWWPDLARSGRSRRGVGGQSLCFRNTGSLGRCAPRAARARRRPPSRRAVRAHECRGLPRRRRPRRRPLRRPRLLRARRSRGAAVLRRRRRACGARRLRRGLPQHGRIALQYWLFHAFDLWSPFVPQSADYWKPHEGDWEAVTVLLDATGPPDRGRREPPLRWRAAPLGEGRAARMPGPSSTPRSARTRSTSAPVAIRSRSGAGRRRRWRSSTRTRSRWSTTPPRGRTALAAGGPRQRGLAGLDGLPGQLRREPVPALPASDVRLRRRPARPRLPRPLAEAVRGAAQLAGGLIVG